MFPVYTTKITKKMLQEKTIEISGNIWQISMDTNACHWRIYGPKISFFNFLAKPYVGALYPAVEGQRPLTENPWILVAPLPLSTVTQRWGMLLIVQFISDLLGLLGIEKRRKLVPSSLSDEQKQAIVDKHNQYRSEEPASNMKYMVCTGLGSLPLTWNTWYAPVWGAHV